MSNKTQLQTNNTSLEECITRINEAKEVATGLPEASGGSSGGSIETCTVTFGYENYYKSCEGYLHYIKPDLSIGSVANIRNLPYVFGPSVSVTALKGSLAFITGDGINNLFTIEAQTTGDIEFATFYDQYQEKEFVPYAFIIKGDGSINVIVNG